MSNRLHLAGMATDIDWYPSGLIDAFENPEEMTTEALQGAIDRLQGEIEEWQEELVRVQKESRSRKEVQSSNFTWPTKSSGTPTMVLSRPEVSSPTASPTATPSAPAPVNRPACRLEIPKELVIDMVDYLTVADAGGRGQRIRKSRKIFEEVAAPSKSKRKRAADGDDGAAAAARPTKKRRATARKVSALPITLQAPS